MKTLNRIIFTLFVFFLLGTTTAQAETIHSFTSDIKLSPKFFTVTETIVYDFGDLQKHGIYREIPIKYQTNYGKRNISIKVLKVLRNGANETYKDKIQGENLSIKIGSADITITGRQEYQITYQVTGAINFFTDFDELYWNVTGNNWQINMIQVTTEINLPASSKLKQVACYQGIAGSQTPCRQAQTANNINFQTTNILYPGEGLTIALGLDKGYFQAPTIWKKIGKIIKDNFILLLPLIVLLIMYLIWQRHGKDPIGRGTIIAEYEPPQNVSPTLVGALIDEKIDNRDITAGLIHLAQQGFIKITRLEKTSIFKSVDYELLVLKNLPSKNEGIDSLISEIFFSEYKKEKDKFISLKLPNLELIPPKNREVGSSIKLSEIRKDKQIAKRIAEFKKNVSEEMVTFGWYDKNPNTVKIKYTTLGGLLITIGFFIGDFAFVYFLSLLLTGGVVMIFGWLMPKKTALGAEVKDHLLGFKEFLSVTDAERFKFHNAPAKNPEQFMQYLPYAVAMGVEKQWAEQFKDIYIQNPDWYQGSATNAFLATQFVGDLSNFNTQMGSNISHASRGGAGSAGGGFSGGGFGGGGGGSW